MNTPLTPTRYLFTDVRMWSYSPVVLLPLYEKRSNVELSVISGFHFLSFRKASMIFRKPTKSTRTFPRVESGRQTRARHQSWLTNAGWAVWAAANHIEGGGPSHVTVSTWQTSRRETKSKRCLPRTAAERKGCLFWTGRLCSAIAPRRGCTVDTPTFCRISLEDKYL